MSAMQRTPLKKKRTGKPRRVLQVCAIRGCKRRATPNPDEGRPPGEEAE